MEIVSYKYATPYLIFLSILTIFLFLEFWQINKGKGTRLARQITLFSFILFFGFKGYIGRDIFAYYDFFTNTPTLWNWNKGTITTEKFEFGFYFYTVIVKTINPNFLFFNFVNILLDAILLNSIIKRHSKYYVFSFIVYIVFYGHLFEMEQIRNAKSVLIFLYSIRYIEDKKIIPYFLLNLLGMSFHFSSIVYFPLYFFLNKKLPTSLYFIIFIIGNVIILFGIEYIKPSLVFAGNLIGGDTQEKITNYLASKIYSSSFGLSLGYFERFVTYILIFFVFYKKLIQSKQSNLIFINLYFLYFVSFFLFSEFRIAVLRLSALFSFSYAILFPNIYGELQKKENKMVMFCILIFYMYLRFATYHKYIEYKYENILWNNINYDERRADLKKSTEYRLKEDLMKIKNK